MSSQEFALGLMKVLSTKHFPLQRPRRKVSLEVLLKAVSRFGCDTSQEDAYQTLNELKGKGLANTDPKILMREELATAEFEIWLTPLGRTELQKLLAT